MHEHEYFVEMCAGYSLGTLSQAELNQLAQHLHGCLECRQALEEFENIVSNGLPAIAPDYCSSPRTSLSEEELDRASQRILAHLENSARNSGSNQRSGNSKTGVAIKRIFCLPGPWNRNPWLVGVLCLLMVAANIAYLQRLRKGPQSSALTAVSVPQQASERNILGRRQSPEPTEREIADLKAETARYRQLLAEATKQLEAHLKQETALRDQLQLQTQNAQTAQNDRALLQKAVAEMQFDKVLLQQKLETAVEDRTKTAESSAELQHRLADLTRELRDKSKALEEQETLLSHDRDIRDVIGARDLYVAEVNDVGRDARTEKPFGRVFFTKGKSLIFYAYDLDNQDGVERAKTFQAWGRRGTDFSNALPLGIMYLDNSSRQRWVLRFDDPHTLAKIDAVFVTVEPKGGSEKPTSKPLLFAYLKIEPNHP